MTAARAPDHYAVIGNPVAHSQSPFIHAEFARATGQAMDYTRVLCPMDGFADAVRAFAAAGGKGCNVTVPFKFESIPLAREVTPRARQAQAANVLRFDADGWLADNTDGIGLVRDLQANAGFRLAGARVLLIGAGGAGAGVLGPLLEAAPAQLQLVNRSRARAEALVQHHAALAHTHRVALAAGALADAERGFDLVLNGSASSLAGAAVPVADHVLKPGTLAVDLMYGTAAAGFLHWAGAHGAVGRDGLGMLVEQAAEAFFVWRGVRPETAEVLRRLRARLDAAF
jgi:shikimate dehydrogenase